MVFTVRGSTLKPLPLPTSSVEIPSTSYDFPSYVQTIELSQVITGFCPWSKADQGPQTTLTGFCHTFARERSICINTRFEIREQKLKHLSQRRVPNEFRDRETESCKPSIEESVLIVKQRCGSRVLYLEVYFWDIWTVEKQLRVLQLF